VYKEIRKGGIKPKETFEAYTKIINSKSPQPLHTI